MRHHLLDGRRDSVERVGQIALLGQRRQHVIDHFDHVVKLVGVDHVGVGSDMDVVGNPNPVNGEPMRETPNWDRYRLHTDEKGQWMLTIRGLDHPRRMFDLTDALIRRGYTDAQIRLILGGNWRRVMGAVQGST